MISDYLMPATLCGLAGLLYGCSFVLQQKSIFLSQNAGTQRLKQLGYFGIRLLILGYTGYYLLRLDLLPSILGLVLFLSMFWLIILMARARIHERI